MAGYIEVWNATKIYNPDDDTNLSAGVAAFTYNTVDPLSAGRGNPLIRSFSFQPIFTNYTSVTVKAQASLDGSTWADISGATTSTTGDVVSVALFDGGGVYQKIRVLVTATLSGSTDTMAVWAKFELGS